MKIVVCGDSYCSADTNRPGTHFSELLNQQGHDVINLARGGMSNIGIAFQMRESLQFEPDVVLFNRTTTRLNLPVGTQKYAIEKGLKNFRYPYATDASSRLSCVGGSNAAIWADVLECMIAPRADAPADLRLSAEQIDAVKKYIAYLYDDNFAMTIDQWVLGYWQYYLRDRRIRVIELSQQGVGRDMYEYYNQYPHLATQSVYHTDEPTQIRVCEHICQEIDTQWA